MCSFEVCLLKNRLGERVGNPVDFVDICFSQCLQISIPVSGPNEEFLFCKRKNNETLKVFCCFFLPDFWAGIVAFND